MSTNAQQITDKLWSYFQVLRHDGLSTGDALEQITFLLFLKIAHERTLPPSREPSPVPEGYDWPSLLAREGDALETHYRHTLTELSKQSGLVGAIFRRALNKIRNPARLRRLMIEYFEREPWTDLDSGVPVEVYEGLLDKKSLTPRPLIEALVDVIRPRPDETICDPACNTGGFLVEAFEAVTERYPRMDRDEKRRLKLNCLRGYEIDESAARLCAMNLFLHGIGPDLKTDADPLVETRDSLLDHPGKNFDIVLTNPLFARKPRIERKPLDRGDSWVPTTSQPLNFVQHVRSLLVAHGRAAVVVPDSVLFEGGAGETLRRRLLHECDVHTLLRLPTGIFHTPGVRANVLFFDRKPARETPWTEELWVYDLRTNLRFPKKTNPFKRSDLDEFVEAYNPDDRHIRQATWSEANPTGRWRVFSYEELVQRERCNLDLVWLKDEGLEGDLPDDVLVSDIVEDLRAALEQIELVQAEVG